MLHALAVEGADGEARDRFSVNINLARIVDEAEQLAGARALAGEMFGG